MESFVGVVTAVTSAITGAVVSVVVAVVDSSFSPQEKMTKLKIMERIMRIYLKELPVSGLGIN